MASRHESRIELENGDPSHALIAGFVGGGKRVLAVGQMAGDLAPVLAERGCTVTGIGLGPEDTRRAEAHFERFVVWDLEEPGRELGDESFDVIVFGDALERVQDPLRTLQSMKHLLRPEGCVVASVHNVAHGSLRLALLRGEFRYDPSGFPDGTQLRFFTRESVERLFEDAGLHVTGLQRVSVGVLDNGVDPDRIPAEVLELVREDPEASTYQFVLAAHRFGDAGTSAKRVRLLSEQLEDRDRALYELNRKLRNFEELRRLLDERTEQLAQKERELTRLVQEVADRNDRMARLVQFGKEDA